MSRERKERIKFLGRVDKRYPQLFPKKNKKFEDGEFAILNFNVLDELEGEVETNAYGNITVKGVCFPPNYDFKKEYVIMAELEKEDKTYGKQWMAIFCNENIDLNDTWQQKIFLQTFLSDLQIKSLFEAFDNPLSVIESGDRDKLKEAHGFGDVIVDKMLIRYNDHKNYAQAYIELVEYGMTPALIKRLVDMHGSATVLVNKIKENPYILADEVKGIGFKKVDDMALESGIPRYSQRRLKAFIKHILNEAGTGGYSWITSSVLIDKIEEDLDIFPMEKIVEAIKSLKEEGLIWNGEKGKVALNTYFNLELNIKNELIRIRDNEVETDFEGWEDRVKEAELLQGWKYTDEQMSGIKNILDNQLSVLTAAAGAGKTATVLGALKAMGDDCKFAQCSLSGKAAARMEESTGYPASTIHRLLGFNPSGFSEDNPSSFSYNKKNKLKLDAIIVDEFPMIGGRLFLNLIEAIAEGTKLILIGDMNQLPAIGALNVGFDLINSKEISTVLLTKVHRQAAQSAIKLESYKVAASTPIIEEDFTGHEIRGELKDLELDIYDESWETYSKVIEYFEKKLALNGNDVMETQIISPITTRGKSSVYAFNNGAQKIYNPESEDLKELYLPLDKEKGYTLRVGDKIINIKNNYNVPVAIKNPYCDGRFGEDGLFEDDKEWICDCHEVNDETEVKKVPVFNGYMGTIVDIQDQDLIIHFPMLECECLVPKGHWHGEKAIHLAYAATTHKLQGSQAKYVIVALDSSHYVMHSRENLYTAMTRASEHCTIVAENQALLRAISITAVQDKQTFLLDMLEDSNKYPNLQQT